MIIRPKASRRRGAVVVESAIVLPVAMMVIFAITAGAIAIFTYQQVAQLAREGARYASVHGYQYSQSTGNSPATSADVYNAMAPYFVNVDTSQLNCAVSWSPDNRQGSYVTVTLTYNMSVPVYGTMTFTSTATQQVTW